MSDIDSLPSVSDKSRSREALLPTNKGRDIRQAAMLVFLEDGYAVFSMRRVAARARISLGTLQYYFPTLERLLFDTVQAITSRFNDETESVVVGPGTAEERIVRFVDVVLGQIHDPHSASLIFELLALGQRNAELGRFVTAAFEQYRGQMVRLLEELDPKCSASDRLVCATVVCAQLEGLLQFHYPNGPVQADWTALGSIIRASALATVHGLTGKACLR